MKAYLAGPMSGIPHMNFPLFDAATMALRSDGWDVVSPAELDSPEEREAALASLDGTMQGLSWGTLLARDLEIIADDRIEAVIVLPGWEKSKGARLETFVGRLLKLPILAYPSLNPIEEYKLEYTHALPAPGILKPMRSFGTLGPPWGEGGTELGADGKPVVEEAPPLDTAESVQADAEIPEGPIKRALPLVHRNRQDAYGHPSEDFARTAGMWKAMFGWNVEPKDVPLAMIAVKLSRLRQSPEHEDSATDIAGYIETYEMTLKGNHDS